MNIKDQLDQANVNKSVDRCLSKLKLSICPYEREDHQNYIAVDNEQQEFEVLSTNSPIFTTASYVGKEEAIKKVIDKIIDNHAIAIYEDVYGIPDYGDINPEIPPEHIEHKNSKVSEIKEMFKNGLDKILDQSFNEFPNIKNSLLANHDKGKEELEL